MDQLVKLPEGTQLTVGSHQVKILKYLSEGGFAHIYKVHIDPKEDGTDIGCLKRVIIPDKTGLDQLRKEVEVMKRLRHSRCLVKYFDSHAERLESGGYQVLVLMELCPNKSLLDLMNAKIKTKLTEPEILQIMIDISIAIYEMHKRGMIHRDIKIENVLLDMNYRYKLGDFGSTSSPLKPATNQQEFQALSHDLLYQTTPQYRSPEMIDLYRGFPIDEKSDIWALGCFLYKLCYYTTPFEANGEIAILHASYQFPPAPVYSGDLKNLIIIMLQESPLFRPNIVQVIKLVAAMLTIDFDSLDVEDIYNAGSYNFHALHEYQRQKQAEMMKQQQMYYQQQQQQQQQQVQNTQQVHQTQESQHTPANRNNSEPTNQKVDVPTDVEAESDVFIEPQVDETTNESNSESDFDTSLGDFGNLDNIEERYPSLENIIVDSETPKSGATSVKSGAATDATSAPYQSSKVDKQGSDALVADKYDCNKTPQVQSSSSYQSPTFQSPVNNFNAFPKPPTLPPQELQKLSPEQLLQYNYQQNAYNYQMNQWMYTTAQQPMQQPSSRNYSYSSTPVDPKTRSTKSMDRTSSFNYAELQNKEAWEQLRSNMNEDTGKLADDIFGSKSRSPAEASAPQKTSQSIKSEPTYGRQNHDEDEEFDNGIRLNKSNASSEIDLPKSRKSEDNYKGPQHGDVEHVKPSDLKLLDGDEGPLEGIPEKDLDTKVYNPEEYNPKDYEVQENTPKDHIPQESGPQQIAPSKSIPDHSSTEQRPKAYIDSKNHSRKSSQIASSPAVPTSSSFTKNNNPFPLKNHNEDENFNDFIEPAKTSDVHKNSNPWGEFSNTNQHSVNMPLRDSNLDLHSRMGSLNMNDRPSTSRKTSVQQPDLIDLDFEGPKGRVASDNHSKSTTSMAGANVNTNPILNNSVGGESLIDLDLEQESGAKEDGSSKNKHPEKPHFKKRVSAIPNPSDFKVQEEVIDWASDDENPNNSSEMSRLSIRNSLKQSRKSGEHKRSESASSDHKKRLSRLILNN